VEGNSGRGRGNEEGKGGRRWLMYFLYMYEYGTLKPATHFKKGSGGRGRIMDR
jgi:hypothetical protein